MTLLLYRLPETVRLSNEFRFLAPTTLHCMCAFAVYLYVCNKNDVTHTHTTSFTTFFTAISMSARASVFVCMRAFYLLNIQIKLSNRQFSGFYIFCFVYSFLC